MKRYLLILLFWGIGMLQFSAKNMAKFKYFNYVGEDKYYRENALQGEGDYFNPVISGWASDPAICRVGKDYWLVTSTFGYFPGVPLYHSEDLVSWEHVGNVLSRSSQLPWLEGLSIDKGGIYAPALSYNPHNQRYYMITTCVMNGGDGSTLNFYVTATDPLGEWSDPVLLPDVEGIDPSFFFDDDGKAYIVYKSDERSPVKWSNHRAMSIIEFNPEEGRTVGEPVLFKEEGVGPEERLERDEGPHIYKIDEKYYLLAAEGGTGWAHSEVCYKADNIFGPYRRWSRNPMLTQRLLKPNRERPVTSTGHADLVQTPSGEWFAFFLGCRPWNEGEDHLGRETFMLPVKWSVDSFPYITQSIDTISLKSNMPGLSHKQESLQSGNFKWSDDFSDSTLRPEWMSLWGDPAQWYRVGDGLFLEYAPVDTKSGKTPSCLLRRIQHHCFEVETELEPKKQEDLAAGLILLKNEQRQLFLACCNDKVILYKLGNSKDDTIIASADLASDCAPVGLKIISRGGSYDFLYRPCGEEWITLAENIPAEYVASQRGGFTGSTIGLYATSALQ
ncbi:MAG: glycoside hydrolase family 43 protein [Muribaculaceae bacterium]|nr:glycoside hydrolase family 43 protein [Muribaculaceae bacterium]